MGTDGLSGRDFAAVTAAAGIVLVDFRDEASGSSRAFATVFDAAARRHPDLRFARVDVRAEPDLAAAVGVQRAPSLMVFRDGVPVFAEPGWLPADSVELLIATVRELDMTAVRETFPEPVRRR
ncbi:co-chaperone YbbN [Geodermatophilus sp. DSM 44513]|uniref:thioredoxin family protein n=1 Tax=Geodermatophilus sp. DSM 44513 TaxID=1528104 RepID=UPI0012788CB1|nr:thioredoxin family protein [Geodermatophilus sp. DSM 44513]WNV73693.1 thioredoxin family protein [Geodermatophilus sp. DSM 44513]